MSSEIPFAYLLCQAWVWPPGVGYDYVEFDGEIAGGGSHCWDSDRAWYGIGYLYEFNDGVSGYYDPSPYEFHIGHYFCVTINSEV